MRGAALGAYRPRGAEHAILDPAIHIAAPCAQEEELCQVSMPSSMQARSPQHYQVLCGHT